MENNIKQKIIYLATCYSHKDPKICEKRFIEVSRYAAKFKKQGYSVFSPISHSHPIAIYGDIDPLDSEFWTKHDLIFLPFCDELWILKLDGWEKSKGIAQECKEANKLGMPIKFIDHA